jgi:serine/threonine-protein kinase
MNANEAARGSAQPGRTLGGSLRYEPLMELASGGMATVYVGHARGAFGFRQLVALKQPHPHLAADEAFRAEFIAEARVASALRHANVVDVRDVDVAEGVMFLVMDYIEGASVGELLVEAARRGEAAPAGVALRICVDALAGLGAAHDLTDYHGAPMGIVHRDVSPQNIIVGLDGVARVSDFGIVKMTEKRNTTIGGALKGKYGYMAPEYVGGRSFDRRFDIFSLGVVLWEMLMGRRLFRGANELETMRRVLEDEPERIASARAELAPLDEVLQRALAKRPDDRWDSAQAMADALERYGRDHLPLQVASTKDVSRWVTRLVGERLAHRRQTLHDALAAREAHSRGSVEGTLRGAPPTEPLAAGTFHGTAPGTQPLPAHAALVPAVSTLPLADGRPAGSPMEARAPDPVPIPRGATLLSEGASSAGLSHAVAPLDVTPQAGRRDALDALRVSDAPSLPSSPLRFWVGGVLLTLVLGVGTLGWWLHRRGAGSELPSTRATSSNATAAASSVATPMSSAPLAPSVTSTAMSVTSVTSGTSAATASTSAANRDPVGANSTSPSARRPQPAASRVPPPNPY